MNSIKTRLAVVLAMTLAATVAMAGLLYFGARNLAQNAQRTREANDDVRDLLSFALAAHRYVGAFGQSLGQRTLVANRERRAAAKEFEQRIAGIPARVAGSSGVLLEWNELRVISADLGRELEVADRLRSDGKFFDAERAFDRARRDHFEQRMLPWFEKAIETQRTEVEALETGAVEQAKVMRVHGAILAIVSALLVGMGALATVRAIIGPVRLLVKGADALAAGDYSHRIAHRSADELGVLAERFNGMAEVVERSRKALLEKNAAIEEAYELQGEFLGIMSHELRSPLNTIIGYTELVLEDGHELSERGAKNVQSIAAGAKRLLALINDILDFSKLKAGRMEVRESDIRLPELARSIVEETRALARGRAIEVNLEASENLGELRSDENKLRQILTNLMSNAVKFTDRGRVTLCVEQNGAPEVVFRVKDTGIGVPEHQLELIFEPFRQAQGADRRAVSGTGLGLAIVARLTGLLGGSVSVQSKVGLGTEFAVRLPSQRTE